MANRRLLIVLIVFIAVAGLAIAGGSIFRVRTIEVRFTNTLDYIGEPNRTAVQNSLATSIAFQHGRSSLFGVDRTRIRTTIEAEDFRVRVTNIEVRFPNIIRVSVRERYPVFEYRIDNRRLIFDSQLRYVVPGNQIPTNRNIIDITGQLGATPEYLSTLMPGDFFFDILGPADTEVALRARRLVEIADLFWARNNYEDSINHLFYSIEFPFLSAAWANTEDMFLTRRGSGGGPTNTFIWIRGITHEGDFRRMLTSVWDVLENRMTHYPGLYEVRIQAHNNRVAVMHDPNWTPER
ncbi:MAG: hypothetical protein FWE38_03975 [Firmicutes bacterium]|nr:hypothetical protein [Bacillota bacterium]